MKYAIMTRNLKSYLMSPSDEGVLDAYNGWLKKYILQKGNTNYGAVLVKMKQVIVGYKLIISFDWEFLKYKKWPKFERFRTAFTWLWFNIDFEKIYSDKPDKVIKDHIADNEVAQ